jgi:hypothetical protein
MMTARASAEDSRREVMEVARPGLGRVPFVIDVPDVRDGLIWLYLRD